MELDRVAQQTIDLEFAIKASIAAVRGLNRVPAAFFGIMLGTVTYSLWFLVLYFDIQPTMIWAANWSEKLTEGIVIGTTVPITYLFYGLTAMPLFFELTGSRFIKEGQPIFRLLLQAFLALDALTDWPFVLVFMDQFDPLFASWAAAGGVWALLAFFGQPVAWLLMLFFATIGFEFLFIMCFVSTAMCALQVVTGPYQTRR